MAVRAAVGTNSILKKLGNPRYLSAPMVDQSDLAFRLLVKKNGVDLAYTQMLHARNFCRDNTYQRDCVDWKNYSCQPFGEYVEKEPAAITDRNLIVQLAGDDPDILERAGKLVQGDASVEAVDLNLGCPQKIAKRGNYGAYLLQDTTRVVMLLKHMVNTLNIPVTAKIRRLSTDDETVDLVRRLEDVGVSMVTVHGRTVEQSKLFTGPCDWGVIKAVKEAVSIPVVANGGVQCRQDALDCLDFTGADMVMSSEALLENPKLFSVEGDIAFRERFVRAQLDTVREYLDIVRSYQLPSPLYQVVRSHLFKMLFRFMDAPSNRDLRTLLGTGDIHDMDYVLLELEKRFDGVQGTPNEIPDLVSRGLLGPTLWYYRHRDDRAQHRIMSLPRKYPNFQGAHAFMSLRVSNNRGVAGGEMLVPPPEDPVEKQKQLKASLLAKRAAKQSAK
jgi:tRNA-dihydrouridine synthase